MPKKRTSKKKKTTKSRKRTYKKYFKKGYRLYKTPALKTGTQAPIKFNCIWSGNVCTVVKCGATYSKAAMLFNPLIGNFAEEEEVQAYALDNQGTYAESGYGPWLPTNMANNTANWFINPYGNPNFRKFLLMYQEMKVDYAYIELQPEYEFNQSLGAPFYISHFEDRTYSGVGGSSIDKYVTPNAMDQTLLETEFAQQGKKWKFFSSENRYYRYKVYLQAMGKEENKYYTTETNRSIQTWKDPALPEPYLGYSITGFYNQALFPYEWSAAGASRQIGFTPTVAFMVKLAKVNPTTDTIINFSYRIKVGYTFRNPGCWVDKDPLDWKCKAWLNAANHQLMNLPLTGNQMADNYHWGWPGTQQTPYTGASGGTRFGEDRWAAIRARGEAEPAAEASAEGAEPSTKRTETA